MESPELNANFKRRQIYSIVTALGLRLNVSPESMAYIFIDILLHLREYYSGEY